GVQDWRAHPDPCDPSSHSSSFVLYRTARSSRTECVKDVLCNWLSIEKRRVFLSALSKNANHFLDHVVSGVKSGLRKSKLWNIGWKPISVEVLAPCSSCPPALHKGVYSSYKLEL